MADVSKPIKSAIVTGAGSGIGRQVVLSLLDAGYHVALAGRRRDALEQTVTLAGDARSRTCIVPTDVTLEADVERLFRETRSAFGRVDLLFNNAGINIPGVTIEDLKLEDWQRVVDVNLTGMLLCIREAFRVMKDQQPQGGRIINNGSVSAHAPRPFSIAYTATKHGVTGLTKQAQLDGRRYNIACGQIDIGNALTEMAAKMTTGVPQADGSIAIEPTMHVADVGRAVVYMAELPLDTNVPFLTVMATKMPLVGRG